MTLEAKNYDPALQAGAQVDADNIKDEIATADLQDNAVTTAKIADDAVTNAKVADNAVDTVQLATDAVENAKIAADAVTESKVSDSNGTAGLYVKKTALAVYDFSVDGGAIGAITLSDTATIPDNAIVTAGSYDVITTCTSATDAATIALSVPTDGVLDTAVPISDAANPWDAGAHTAVTPLPKKLTGARALQITVATEALTAGKIIFSVDYYISE